MGLGLAHSRLRGQVITNSTQDAKNLVMRTSEMIISAFTITKNYIYVITERITMVHQRLLQSSRKGWRQRRGGGCKLRAPGLPTSGQSGQWMSLKV